MYFISQLLKKLRLVVACSSLLFGCALQRYLVPNPFVKQPTSDTSINLYYLIAGGAGHFP